MKCLVEKKLRKNMSEEQMAEELEEDVETIRALIAEIRKKP